VDAAAGALPALDGAKALDAAIAVLGQHTYAQLIAPGGRASAQKVLSVQVKKRYDGDVLGVYFTEFLMQ
jgi:flagellar FliL protein